MGLMAPLIRQAAKAIKRVKKPVPLEEQLIREKGWRHPLKNIPALAVGGGGIWLAYEGVKKYLSEMKREEDERAAVRKRRLAPQHRRGTKRG